MQLVIRNLLAAVALAWATAATGAPTLDPMFGADAVIQRDAPVRIRGSAAPGEPITVGFAGRSRSVRANKQGDWHADFAPLNAGGPYRIEARGSGGSDASADNVMVGDVWLCSGQSNMEFPLRNALNGEGEVAGANDPQLRLLKISHNHVLSPQMALSGEIAWKPAVPDSVRDFSAACYFMARALRQSHGIAIGAIDSTWGGTAIHSWMDDASVRATGGATDVELLKIYRDDPARAVAEFGTRWTQWWRERSGDAVGAEPWHASDRLAWTPMPKMTFWEQWGDPAFADFNGAIWARVRFTLTAEEAAQAAVLHLGAIDDFDRTFVNGEAVGETLMYDKPRNYAVRAALLKAGLNEVIVYVLDTGGGGGFWGPAEALKLSFANGAEKPLAGWAYSVVPTEFGTPPLPPWDGYPGPTTLYNGMIAPIGSVHLKGVAWYQGEADVGTPDYDRRLAAMMKGWRGQFDDPQLPFLIVGLAGFGQPVSKPAASNWAALIDEQRKAADRDPRTALVSAIDIGERNDIHPANKQEVGRRLTLAAEALAYDDPKAARTPKVVSAVRNASTVIVQFDQPVIGYGGAPLLGFELCGDTQSSCRYADAHASGPTVIVAADAKPATRVRYAWADYPIVNLYGPGRLPVPPFEIAIRR
jgi:sialate O-acetylesterase